MEYIEIQISSYKKFIDFIRIKLLYCTSKSIDNDELFTPGKLILKLVNIVREMTPQAESMLNDLYGIIKKYYSSIKEYSTSTISRDNRLSDLRKASIRATIYIKEIYGDILRQSGSTGSNNDFGFLRNTGETNTENNLVKFKLFCKPFSKMPFCEEYVMFHLVLHEENIFFHRVNDTIYKFFYFYKSIDNIWYWSPPKKTDPEDIWMQCPKYIVDEGYWKGTQIPRYVEEFVVWLDIFKPDLPYIERQQESN